jgi:cytochrome c peroxidase
MRMNLLTLPHTLLRAVSSVTAAAVLVVAVAPTAAYAAREGECPDINIRDVNPGPGSLKRIRPIEPANLGEFVRDRQAAIVLGKALFWDMQVGSDGIQACASCHFLAGADPRSRNQLAPGGANVTRNVIDLGVNTQLNSNMFPLHKLADPTDRRSRVIHSYDDVVSSQGVKLTQFLGATPGASQDQTSVVADPVFQVNGRNVRRNEPRNTPTVINAAYNRRNFWDGRADHIFNGVNPFGVRDPNARVGRVVNGVPQLVKIRIDNASLASQAVGPLTSDLEMAALNRPLLAVGKRLLTATPLKKQVVDPNDSVLGPYALNREASDGDDDEDDDRVPGMRGTYLQLVQQAFRPEWWQSNQVVTVASNGTATFGPAPATLAANQYTLAEYNFALFFGLAVQMYEFTLISDDAPIDRYFEGNRSAISDRARRGLDLFVANTCAACHAGAEFTNASTRILLGADGEPGEIIERMPNGNCRIGIYDQSFYNLGVRPWYEDLGIGAKDPFGNPLSIARVLTTAPSQIPSQELLTIPYPNILNPPPAIGERTAVVDGAFKVPSLRNVALTAPYFHTGGYATLKQAVQFYNRGGDFRETNSEQIDFEIGKLNLPERDIDDIVEFLRTLTDERVTRRRAPFDHPELFVPNGQRRDSLASDGTWRDIMLRIPQVGRSGGNPLPKFLENLEND